MLASSPRTAEHLSRHLLRLAHTLAHSRRRYTHRHTHVLSNLALSLVCLGVSVYTVLFSSPFFFVVVFELVYVSLRRRTAGTPFFEILH